MRKPCEGKIGIMKAEAQSNAHQCDINSMVVLLSLDVMTLYSALLAGYFGTEFRLSKQAGRGRPVELAKGRHNINPDYIT
jgi:hypothetical protein